MFILLCGMSLFLGGSPKTQWERLCKSTGGPVIADVTDLGMLFPFSELLLKRGWVTTVGFYSCCERAGLDHFCTRDGEANTISISAIKTCVLAY